MSQHEGIDVLISAFVHYSELSSVKYEEQNDILKVDILLNSLVGEEVLTQFINRVRQCLKLYFSLAQKSPRIVEMEYSKKDEITLVRLYRDAESLSEKEMELYILLLRDQFDGILIKEQKTKVSEKSCERHIKQSLLQAEKNGRLMNRTLFAYRDKGTMYVFNK